MSVRADDRYPSVIEAVRQNMGLEKDDESRDEEILQMSRDEVFRRFMTWNGIIGYEGTIKEAIEEIYKGELGEVDE